MIPEKSFLLLGHPKVSDSRGETEASQGATSYLANIPSSKSETGATFLIGGLPLTCSLSPGGTAAPPGNAQSPAASPSSPPKAAAGPPSGAPAALPGLEAGILRSAEPPSGTLFPASALVSRTQQHSGCGAKVSKKRSPSTSNLTGRTKAKGAREHRVSAHCVHMPWGRRPLSLRCLILGFNTVYLAVRENILVSNATF